MGFLKLCLGSAVGFWHGLIGLVVVYFAARIDEEVLSIFTNLGFSLLIPFKFGVVAVVVVFCALVMAHMTFRGEAISGWSIASLFSVFFWGAIELFWGYLDEADVLHVFWTGEGVYRVYYGALYLLAWLRMFWTIEKASWAS